MMQDETRTLANTVTEPAEKGFDRAALLSVGGIVAALGAATCCVLPFALFFAGISGAWIGNLTAFEPYQPVFITIALACLGKPHSASALVAALKALETMICKNEAPRKVSGLTTFWRPEAA